MPLTLIAKRAFHIVTILLLTLGSCSLRAQETDSLQARPAEEVVEQAAVSDSAAVDTNFSVKKAVLWSFIPGGGQIYNGKYWKLPLVYGALGGTLYATSFNHQQYQIYLDAFYSRIDEDPNNDKFVGVYDERQLIELQNTYRKWRDLSIILTAAAYGLQMLDAYVDAHLHSFNVSDNLSLRWEPAAIQTDLAYYPQALGLGISLHFK